MRKSAAFDSAEFDTVEVGDATGVGVAADCGVAVQPTKASAASAARVLKAPPS
jgi:hypothetical protein